MYELESIQRIVKMVVQDHTNHERRERKIHVIKDMVECALDHSVYKAETRVNLWAAMHVLANSLLMDKTHSEIKDRLWIVHDLIDQSIICESWKAVEETKPLPTDDFAPPDKDMDDLPF